MRRFAVLPVLLAVAATAGAAPAAVTDDSVQWGGRTFRSASDFAQWLEQRGLAYGTWARNHPGGAARLEGREEAAASLPPAAPTAPPPAELAGPPAPRTNGAGPSLLIGALGVLAAALLVLAILPMLRPFQARAPGLLTEHQPELAGAAIAIAVAVAAASLI